MINSNYKYSVVADLGGMDIINYPEIEGYNNLEEAKKCAEEINQEDNTGMYKVRDNEAEKII